MCILFLELCACPRPGGFRLILASNRDEHYKRPAAGAHHWTEAPSVFGGRDMEQGREGGTWLAMDTAGYGRVAALLNVLGGASSLTSLGRGPLVADLLTEGDAKEHSVRDYFQRIAKRGQEYNAFHLVAVDLNPSTGGIYHYSNCSSVDGVGTEVTHLKEGRLSLGNSLSQRPFKKVRAGEQRFDECVQKFGRQETRDQLVEELVALLKWRHEHVPDEELEARSAKVNFTPEKSRLVSSIFQRHPEYGTRTHTVILVDADWRCDFHEWTLEAPVNPDTSRWIHVHKVFQLGKSS